MLLGKGVKPGTLKSALVSHGGMVLAESTNRLSQTLG
jgi:hypothetical protein